MEEEGRRVWTDLILLCEEHRDEWVARLCAEGQDWVVAYAIMAASVCGIPRIVARLGGVPPPIEDVALAAVPVYETVASDDLEWGNMRRLLAWMKRVPRDALKGANFKYVTPWEVVRLLELGASPLYYNNAPQTWVYEVAAAHIMAEHAATRYWSRQTHWEYPRAFRESVFAFLCANARLRLVHRNLVDAIVRHACAALWEDSPPKHIGDPFPPTAYLQCECDRTNQTRVFPLRGRAAIIGGRPEGQLHTLDWLQHIDVSDIAQSKRWVAPRSYALYYSGGVWMLEVHNQRTRIYVESWMTIDAQKFATHKLPRTNFGEGAFDEVTMAMRFRVKI